MNKTPAYHIFLGLLIGAAVGSGIGAVNENTILGLQYGTAGGLFVAWVITRPHLSNRVKGE
jgi:hypothetical protein